MSWIDTPPDHAYRWHVRLLLAFLASRGRLSQSVRLWARSPRAFLSFLRLFKAVDRDSFTDDAIVELSALVAFQNMSSKFNAALDVPAEGFCRVPGRQPAPGGVQR